MLTNAAAAFQPDETLTAIEMLAEGRITRAYFEEMTAARRRSRRTLEAMIDSRMQSQTGDRDRGTERHRRPVARPEPAPHQLRLVGSW